MPLEPPKDKAFRVLQQKEFLARAAAREFNAKEHAYHLLHMEKGGDDFPEVQAAIKAREDARAKVAAANKDAEAARALWVAAGGR